MAESSGWCTIESDPGVLTELLTAIGVQGVQVDEIYTLDRASLLAWGRVYGVIFLFKYRDNEQQNAAARSGRNVPVPPGLFFANQTIRNACATQAILSIVLNAPGVDVGDELRAFKSFADDMDPVMKGMVVSNSQTIREAHNSFAVQQTLIIDEPSAEKEDPFHFVAYIPWKDHVYELDGLQQGPRQLDSDKDAAANDADWLDTVVREISSRIAEYGDSEIRFNLMLVVEDQRSRLQDKIKTLEAPDDAGAQRSDEGVVETLLELRDQLSQENTKREQWAVENTRRRWNFMPFIVELLKVLAKTGHVDDMIDKATEQKKVAFRQAVEARGEKLAQVGEEGE